MSVRYSRNFEVIINEKSKYRQINQYSNRESNTAFKELTKLHSEISKLTCRLAFSVSNSRIINSSSCLCSASISAISCRGESGTAEMRSPLCNFWQYCAIKECSSVKALPLFPGLFPGPPIGGTNFRGSGCCCGVTRVELKYE